MKALHTKFTSAASLSIVLCLALCCSSNEIRADQNGTYTVPAHGVQIGQMVPIIPTQQPFQLAPPLELRPGIPAGGVNPTTPSSDISPYSTTPPAPAPSLSSPLSSVSTISSPFVSAPHIIPIPGTGPQSQQATQGHHGGVVDGVADVGVYIVKAYVWTYVVLPTKLVKTTIRALSGG